MSNTTSTVPPTSSSSQAVLSSSSVEASITSSIASSVSSAVLGGSTTTVQPTSTNVVTSVVSGSSVAASTELITSVVTQSATISGQTSLAPVTIVVTSESNPTTVAAGTSAASSTTSASASSSSSAAASLQNNGSSNSGSSGLSTGGKTAIAVVVPVVVVALLVLAGLYLWRRRKQNKAAEEARRKEVEDYGYNPNSDPTLPAIGTDAQSEMTEDRGGGYRGWGAAAANRKASTTLSGGHTQNQPSDAGSNPAYSDGRTAVPGSDGYSDVPRNRSTMDSDDLAALGAAPAAGAGRHDGMKRGPSNASSSYSAGNRSDHSDPNIGQAFGGESYNNSNPAPYGFSQAGPYGDGSYGGGDHMPVVRDVSARRNTRIEQGGGYQQGNSGIAQNF